MKTQTLALLAWLLWTAITPPAAAGPLFGAPIPYDFAPVDPALGEAPPRGIAVGDLNGDGIPDLVVPNYSLAYAISVFLGNGNGTFQPRQDYVAGIGSVAVAVADFNGDGRQDVAATAEDGMVWVFLGRGDGTLDPATGIPSGYPNNLVAGDLNGDRKPDLVVAGYAGVSIMLGKGDGTFEPSVVYSTSGPWGIAIGDVNRDGRQDVVTSGFGSVISSYTMGVLIGNGDGTLQPTRYYPAPTNSGMSIAIADIDRDANPDIVVQYFGLVSVHLGDGSGAFPSFTSYATHYGQPGQGFDQGQGLAVGDLDNDGLPDIAIADEWGPSRSRGTLVLRGTIDRTFFDPVFVEDQIYGSRSSYAVTLADLDRDGRTDLVSIGEVLLNTGPTAPRPVPDAVTGPSIRVVGPIKSSLSLRYRVPSNEAATVEVFDVRGRLAARRKVQADGSTWQTISFGSLRSGVYMVRLNQAGKSGVSRGVVVR